jgi:hypothetical protein
MRRESPGFSNLFWNRFWGILPACVLATIVVASTRLSRSCFRSPTHFRRCESQLLHCIDGWAPATCEPTTPCWPDVAIRRGRPDPLLLNPTA